MVNNPNPHLQPRDGMMAAAIFPDTHTLIAPEDISKVRDRASRTDCQG
jgi:hypothetical protein